jgi:tetratricopeptide (TPR) repeat protein
LDRNEEALQFLQRAKRQESENPFVLDLESRILEHLGQLTPAYESALLASARDPINAHRQNRLGVIRVKQGAPQLAISHFEKAIELDQDLVSPANSLASAYLDTGDIGSAERLIPQLKAKARTPSNLSLVRHTEARVAFAKKYLEQSREILKYEVTLIHNVVPNLGLLVRVECAIFDRDLRTFPTMAALSLKSAEAALARIVALDQSNEFIDALRAEIEERHSLVKHGTTGSKMPGKPQAKVSTAPPVEVQASPASAPSPPLRKKPPIKPPLSLPQKPPFKR